MFFCLKNQFWVIKVCQIKRKTTKLFLFFFFLNLTKKHLVGMYEFLPFDELAAPFFGEKESIISVKNKIQFVFNLLVDTIKKAKKAVCQSVCV